MPKQPLYEPGEVYHVYNHANGRENIFGEEENYLVTTQVPNNAFE